MTTAHSKLSLKETGKKTSDKVKQTNDFIKQIEDFDKKCKNFSTRFQKVRDFSQRLFQARTKTATRPAPQQTRTTQNQTTR